MYRILLADDEGIVLDSLKFIITKNYGEACEIRTAKTGRQVIEIVQEFSPDIAFVDIQMPGIKGIDAIREVRAAHSRCQFIIMSAYDKFTFAQEAINLGVIEYLTKPASKEKILAALDKAMSNVDRSRAQRNQDLIIREKLEAVVPIIENGFVNILLFQDDQASYIERYRSLLNLTAENGWIMLIEYSGSTADEPVDNPLGATVHLQNHRLAFREILKDFFPNCIIGATMAGTVAVFVPSLHSDISYEERIRIIDISRNLVRKLTDRLNLRFRAGIGNIHVLEEQHLSYEDAKKALRINTSSVVHLKDTKMELEYAPDYPDELERSIFASVIKGDREGTVRSANQFFDWMIENYGDYMQSIRTKSLEFVMWAEREVFLKGGIPYDFLYRKDYLDHILNCTGYEELRRWFIGKLMDTCRSMTDVKNQKETSIIGKAMAYIQQNYHKELSLEDVSRYVDISPYYFSKLFKEESGQTFVEYLTGLRIGRAKEMLLGDPAVSIKEICISVGYADPNYFSRIFKKVTGSTPTEYREEH